MFVVHSDLASKSSLNIGYYNTSIRSTIGSPFLVGRDGTVKECQLKYRKWLWDGIQARGEVYFELRRIQRTLAVNPEFQFDCKQGWHVPVVRAALKWLDTQPEDMPADVEQAPQRKAPKSRQMTLRLV